MERARLLAKLGRAGHNLALSLSDTKIHPSHVYGTPSQARPASVILTFLTRTGMPESTKSGRKSISYLSRDGE